MQTLGFSHTPPIATKIWANAESARDLGMNSVSEVRQKISFTAKLRGEKMNANELRALDDKQALAGLRNTSEAIARLPGHLELGTVLAALFRKILRQRLRLREILVLLGSGQSTPEQREELSANSIPYWSSPREWLAKVLSCSDTEPVDTGECSTNIRAGLLKRWADAARDPRRRSLRVVEIWRQRRFSR